MSFLNGICLLNVLYILVKYNENILTCFKVTVRTIFLQFRRQGEITYGPSQLDLSLLYPTPLPNALYNLTECHENSSRVLRSYGVHNNAFMDRQMDGWMDSMLIAISPKPISRRITKFNKRS